MLRGAAADAARTSKETILAKGSVKWFNLVTGYGMIEPDDGSQAVFVDSGAVERAGLSGLRKGQKLAFDIVSERGRSAAANLRLLEPAEPAESGAPTARS
jgi:cold shock protein